MAPYCPQEHRQPWIRSKESDVAFSVSGAGGLVVVLADIVRFSAWSLGSYLYDTALWLCSPGSECLMAPPLAPL